MEIQDCIIYTRISTDESRQKYSIIQQKELTERHGISRGLNPVAHFTDQASGKNFDRKGFTQLMEYIKKNKNIKYLLISKWDRLGRNLELCWKYIRVLREKYGIQVVSVLDPVDLSSPQAKVLLAVFLVTGEVEREMISQRVKSNMHKAAEKGCWVWNTPRGFQRDRDENNNATLKPNHETKYIIEAFETFANTALSMNEVRAVLAKKGFRISKQGFIDMLSRVVYIGNVPYLDVEANESKIAKGKHKGIISEELFLKVQDKKLGRKQIKRKPKRIREGFELRGVLVCNRCQRKLTGSTSRSRNKLITHNYYHCQNGCKERHRADTLNQKFRDDLIEKLQITPEVSNLYKEVLKENFKGSKADRGQQIRELKTEEQTIQKRIERAEDSLFDGLVTTEEYQRAKSRYKAQLEDIQAKIANLKTTDSDIIERAEKGLHLLENLCHYYDTAEIEVKQKMIGSIYGKEIVFDGLEYRTSPSEVVVELLSFNSKGYGAKNKKTLCENHKESSLVVPAGIEPATQGFSVLCSTN